MPTKLQNQQPLNSEKHKFRKRMVPISNSFVGSGKTPSLRALAPLGIFACSILGVINVSALSISVPQTIGFDVISGKASHSDTATIEVLSSDAVAGYTLTLSGPNSEGSLIGQTRGGKINSIATGSSFDSEADFTTENTWGLKYCEKMDAEGTCINSAKYQAAPKTGTGTTPLEIDKTVVSSTETVSYALAIGAKTSEGIVADNYVGGMVLAATPNPVYHFVGYADWTDGLPNSDIGEGLTVGISSQEPTKTGYKFKGWCPVKPTNNGTNCPDNALITKGTSNYKITATNGVGYSLLYATWDVVSDFDNAFEKYGKSKYNGTNYYAMQDMTSAICSAVSAIGEASVTQLIDKRDNNIYPVGKMIDGNCWLLDNLRLTDAAGDLSHENTNVPEDWSGFGFPEENHPYRLPPSGDTCFNGSICSNNGLNGDKDYHPEYTGYTVPAINASVLGQHKGNDEIAVARTEWDYGVFYNYAAATAGSINEASGIGIDNNAQYDICPKGWKLPTRNMYQGFYIALGGGYYPENANPNYGKEARVSYRSNLHLPMAGYFFNGSLNAKGTYSLIWSSTINSNGFAYNLQVDTDRVYPQNTNNRNYGLSVRCVAK